MTCDFELRAADMDDILHQVLQISVAGPEHVEKARQAVPNVEVQNVLVRAIEMEEHIGTLQQVLLVEPERVLVEIEGELVGAKNALEEQRGRPEPNNGPHGNWGRLTDGRHVPSLQQWDPKRGNHCKLSVVILRSRSWERVARGSGPKCRSTQGPDVPIPRPGESNRLQLFSLQLFPGPT